MKFNNSGTSIFFVCLILLMGTLGINSPVLINAELETNQVYFETKSFLNSIIDTLRSQAKYDNDSQLLGWPLSIDGYDDEYIARGYRTGLTGIGDFLIDYHDSNFSDGDDLLNDTIQHLTTRYSTSNNGLYWTRFVGINSEAWTSYRYGSAGILDFLSRSNQVFPISNYSYIVSFGLTWLKSLQLETGDFPMAPNSYITTDFEYGATGIAQGLLNMYKRDDNSTLLDVATNITNWIIDRGLWKDQNFRLPWTLYGEETEFVDESYKSLTSGMAGVLNLMLDMYQATNKSKYLDTAIGIGNYLVNTENNGQWDESAVNYVTKIGINDGLIGYHVGSSGIAISLLRLFDFTEDQSYLDTAIRVEDHINHLVSQDGAVSISEEQQDKIYTGFSMGESGVAYYQLLLYERFKKDSNLNLAIYILNHLYEIYNEKKLLPYDEEYIPRGYYLNLEHGIAGLGKVLIKLLEVAPDLGVNNSKTSDSSNLQMTSIDKNLIIIGVLSSVLIITIIVRKYAR